jgi:carboxyl-terminal processing protease
VRDPGRVRPVRTRQDARSRVDEVARLANSLLGVNSTAVILEYLCGAANSLDPYSTYLTSDELDEVYSQIEGNFVGLGVELKADAGSLLIVNVITGSPAARAGIVDGDRIVAVDGQSTKELSTDQAADLLQGPEGSTVRVDVVSSRPESRPRRLTVRREHVEVPSVDDVKIVDATYGVGYLKLTTFQKTTTSDLTKALWTLHKQGMKSLIMDLRGNPGGLLTSSVEAVDKFVQHGTIVSTRGRGDGEDFSYTAHERDTWRMPLVVLIDGDSASASEIFAGAIREHRRGTIVGARSYGKGSVQGIFPLGGANSGVRLTTAKFYSPTGRPYSGVGVEPDVIVRRTARPVEGEAGQPALLADSDLILDAGLEVLRRQMARR